MNPRARRAGLTGLWMLTIVIATGWALIQAKGDGPPPEHEHAAHHHGELQEQTSDATARPAAGHDDQTLVQVRDGQVVGGPQTMDVELGEEVDIRVVADVNDEVHVHGYDHSHELVADRQETVTFTADIPGLFDVELEEHHLRLVVLRVR